LVSKNWPFSPDRSLTSEKIIFILVLSICANPVEALKECRRHNFPEFPFETVFFRELVPKNEEGLKHFGPLPHISTFRVACHKPE
jgi:hypothetical protein